MSAPHQPSCVVIVSVAATFGKRAGSGAYLASFCRVLRAMGCRVEVLFLNPIPYGKVQVCQQSDYLVDVNAAALRGAVRVGSRFLTRSPKAWARAAINKAVATLDFAKPNLHDHQALGSGAWNLPWPSNEAVQWARRRISSLKPDIVVANYFNASRAFEPTGLRYRKTVLVHDIFALRRQSYASAGLPLDFDEKMVEAESEGLAAAHLCLTITRNEADFIERHHPHVRTIVFPYVTDVATQERRERPAARCLFVGSDNDPNRRGLAWLLREVWPHVLQQCPQVQLRVAGNVQIRDEFTQIPNVEFAGVIPDLKTEYTRAAVALVPLRVGSGLKVKLVEALAHGVPVVATACGAVGAEATPPGLLRVHDDAKDFAYAVRDVITAPNWTGLSASALEFVHTHYSEAAGRNALQRAFSFSAFRTEAIAPVPLHADLH